MTTTEAPKKIKITMSERRPLSIVEDEWPLIASADWHNGQVECQANTIRRIKVREHADGRRLVYGFARAGNGGQHAGTRNPEGGFLVSAKVGYPVPSADDDETVRAIRRIGGILGDDAWEEARAGEMVEPGEDVAAVVRRVGERARCSEAMIDECIADLPAEDLDDAPPVRAASRGPSDAEPLGDFWGAVSRMSGVAVSKEKLATLLALLVQARPHCPADLQQEIVEALASGAA